MALDTMIKKLVDARKAYDAQLAELGKGSADAVAAHLAPKIPAGYYVTWTQGTPSFNDGDPCTFNVREAYLVPVKAAASESTSCTCGHSVEEHGGNDEFPGATDCGECDEGDCVAFEADPDASEDDVEPEEREDTLELGTYNVRAYGQPYTESGTRPDGTTWEYTQEAIPELPGVTREALTALTEAFKELPEDLLERAFGESRPRVNADGTHVVGDWECGY